MSLGPGWGYAVNNFYAGKPGEAKHMIDLARIAEDAGYDSVWLGDHILWHTPMVDATALLAAFTATTEKVKLGMGIMLLGLRQPGIAAKFLTSVNELAQGRLVLGLGVGGENPAEFEFAGVPHNQRGKRLDESLRVLLEQWDPATAKVAPAGPPIPLFIGGRSDAARRRVVEFDAGWIAAFVSPRRVREEAALLEEVAGRKVPIILNLYIKTGADHDATVREAHEFLGHVYNMDSEPLMRNSLAGSVDHCAEQLVAFREAGVEHVILRPAAWEQQEQLEQWAGELMPKVDGVTVAPS